MTNDKVLTEELNKINMKTNILKIIVAVQLITLSFVVIGLIYKSVKFLLV